MRRMMGAGYARSGGASSRLLIIVAIAALALTTGSLASAQQGGQSDGDDGAVAMGSQGRMVRGTVTATAADHLTLKTESGDIYQVQVTTNTRMMKDRQPVKLADVHAGDGVGAMGVIDAPAKTVHAAMLMVVDAAQIKKAKEDMGKTYISGKVTTIDDVELTIHRSDGVDQKITVDESTSFKKGRRWMMNGDSPGNGTRQSAGGVEAGESITLADIKVGDMVFGPGALKAGVFVPTQLAVMDPASTGRRRRPESGDAPAATVSTPTPAATGANPH